VGFLLSGGKMLAVEVEARHTREAVEEEIRTFEERASQLQWGEISEDQFRPFRLKHGIYGQRQPGFQMVRVKIPSGLLNPNQLSVLADIAETYSTGRGYVTTRENIQFHFVSLENVPTIMRWLADAGLTTREACGNTVRNVTSCPLAGVCPTETFDVTPYALATTRFFLRHPEFHDLPRKFKIAFSGCEDDGNCAVGGIHDIGLIARVRGSNGTAHRGFKVLVGGGLGSLPTEAATLTEFSPEEELISTLEASLRVFKHHGNRKNKFKARMKFVLREKGIEEFRRLVAEKRAVVETPAEAMTMASRERHTNVRSAHIWLFSRARSSACASPAFPASIGCHLDAVLGPSAPDSCRLKGISVRPQELDGAEMDDFAGFRIHFRRDGIALTTCAVALRFKIQHATVECLGVPLADNHYVGRRHLSPPGGRDL
jgi:sulfite reductase beta subunit-like hemoprotein